MSGHLFICVLACHVVHYIRLRLKQGCVHDSLTALHNVLLPHDRATVSMQCKDGSTVPIRKSMEPDWEQKKIYSILGVKCHPGNSVKTTIAAK
ncbi:MAG: hypothetical protein CSA26_00885 [Desulfobacterales bacterium]|nr:MAG: hypothetical protein CSA26_00885 [Desulfobacterales bacterium]